jgi:hypothetical protein
MVLLLFISIFMPTVYSIKNRGVMKIQDSASRQSPPGIDKIVDVDPDICMKRRGIPDRLNFSDSSARNGELNAQRSALFHKFGDI